MSEINTHKINECNEAITITADARDEKYGNSSHNYMLMFLDKGGAGIYTRLEFQRGPIMEVGVNGITTEALLAVLIDRMEGFQSGPFACSENEEALSALKSAMEWFHVRTKARLARGVEGTNVV